MSADLRLPVVLMVLLALAGLALVGFYVSPGHEGSFKENMIPQLIGFCLEGFFLVGLLSLLQKAQEQRQRRALWLSLRGSLRGLLSRLDIALLPPHAEPATTPALEQDPAVVKRYLRELAGARLELEDMLALRREAIEVLGLGRDMIPVAAQLSTAHMRWWIAIVDSLRQMSRAGTRAALEQAASRFLQNLVAFDALEL